MYSLHFGIFPFDWAISATSYVYEADEPNQSDARVSSVQVGPIEVILIYPVASQPDGGSAM